MFQVAWDRNLTHPLFFRKGISVPEVKEMFAAHVEVQYVSLPRNTETGEIKGFAFIDVPTEDEIPKAVEALNGIEVEGRNLRVSKVLPKDQVRSQKKASKFQSSRVTATEFCR